MVSELQKAGARLHARFWWLLPVTMLALGTVLARSLVEDRHFLLRYTLVALVGVCAFAWGYAKRAVDVPVWPPLAHLGRRQYRETWDALARSVVEPDETQLRLSANAPLAIITRLAAPTTSDDVLEIACGVGRIGAGLAPMVRSWTGTDISPNMLEKARRRLGPFTNVRLHQLDGHGLAGLSAESFDLVYCINVFPHLDEMDRWQYVQEAFRVLRPGGRVMIDALDLASAAGWATFQRNAEQLQSFERPPYIPWFSTAEELEIYLHRAGFGQTIIDRENQPSLVAIAVKPREETGPGGQGARPVA
jgi:SAM-dependent methyltransferase